MRVIVCGGRDYADQKKVDEVLDGTQSAGCMIHDLFHGNARGADNLADVWGRKQPHCRVHPIPAQWKKYGKRAGPIRNQQMLGQSPDLVVAFPGGRGTADMVRRAETAGVEVLKINN